jgi:SagB-type dehydrogenase family enzyme
MLPVENADTLPLLFHLNSEPWQNQKAYTDPSNEARFDQPDNSLPSLKLPPGTGSKLSTLLEKRRSCRSFEPRPLPLPVVSEILAAAYGITGINSITGELAPLCARPLPSAGGLYPLEIYLSFQNVEGADDGLYRYNPLHHLLELVRTGHVTKQLTPFMNGQPFMEGANVIFFITADFARTLKKYGPRGYRYLLLEAGHCGQNISLLAAENDLGALCAGGFLDRGLNDFLDLEEHEYTVYCVAVGNRAL